MSTSGTDLDDTVSALRALVLAAERFRHASAEQGGIGVSDTIVLSHLGTAGGTLTPGQLSERLLLRSGTLTAILDRLTAADYVTRTPNPEDRRSVLVTLRPAGRRFLAAGRKRMASAVTSVLNSDGTAAELSAQLSQLAAGLDAQTERLLKRAAAR